MKTVLIILAGAMIITPTFGAYSVNIQDINPPTNNGGPFEVKISGQEYGAGFTFDTFCVELAEAVGLPGTYDATIDNTVINGTWPGPVYYSTLQKTTKQIYAAFWNSGFVDQTYNNGSFYQDAIWYAQANNGAQTAWVTANIGNWDISGWSSVKVLNLTKNGVVQQSQLIMVPVPGALLLGSLGMGLVGWLRRRQTV